MQFGGPRIGHDSYPGFQFVQYECRANYYFDNRTQIMEEDSVLCPSRLRDCAVCGKKIGGLVCTRKMERALEPFCSDQCAISWARTSVAT